MTKTLILVLAGLVAATAAVIYFYGSALLQAAAIGAVAAVFWKLVQPNQSDEEVETAKWEEIEFLRRVQYSLDRIKDRPQLELGSTLDSARIETIKTTIGYLHNKELLDREFAAKAIGALQSDEGLEDDAMLRRLSDAVRLAIAKEEAAHIVKPISLRRHSRR